MFDFVSRLSRPMNSPEFHSYLSRNMFHERESYAIRISLGGGGAERVTRVREGRRRGIGKGRIRVSGGNSWRPSLVSGETGGNFAIVKGVSKHRPRY